jgi:hypothetical protein
MMAAVRRLAQLENRFMPVQHNYFRDPRKRRRVTITNVGKPLSLETSSCRRTLSDDHEHAAFIPAANPTHAPAINLIAQLDCPA